MGSRASKSDSSEHLTRSASRGVLWTMTGNMGVSAVRFISTMILARILAPEEFGIIGMAMLFIGMIGIFGNLGMSSALIQMKEVDEEYMSTGFWTNMLCATGLFLATVIAAPFAAIFFNEPNVKPILIVLGTTYIFSALASGHITLLYRELRFKEVSLIEIITSVFRVIVIIAMGLSGWGFWSLVWGTVIERIAKTILLVRLEKWSPQFIFSKEKFHRLFHFGKNLYGQSFVNYFSGNLDSIVIGRVLGAHSLAFYQFAYNLPHLVLQHISMSIETVTFPVFSKIQDEKERLAGAFLRTTKYISLITFPLMAGLCFVAKDFVDTAYGHQWEEAVLPMQILCLSGAFRSIFVTVNPVLQAIGRPDIILKYTLGFMPVVIGLIIFLCRWGTTGVAIGMVLGCLVYMILVRIGAHLVNTSLRMFLFSLVPATVCSVLMVAALFGVNKILPVEGLFPWARLGMNVVLGAGFYIAAGCLTFRKDFLDLFNFVKKMILKK